MRKFKKINILDFIGAIVILSSLYLVTLNYKWWLLYALGCFIWIIIHLTKKLWFGAIMNLVAVIIALVNFCRR